MKLQSLVVCVLSLPALAAPPLIDNLAEAIRSASPISTGEESLWAAQGFSTDARRYDLVSIDTIMGNLVSGSVTAELRSGADPQGPLLTTLTVGPVSGAGFGEVTLTPDTPVRLDASAVYMVVIYGPEGTAFDWAYAEGNNYTGAGFFDNFWYSTDLGLTWVNFGSDNPFFLRVNATEVVCAADLNGDGVVDFNDYLEFLNLYNLEDLRADFNGDGVVDFNDYLEFLNLYNEPC